MSHRILFLFILVSSIITLVACGPKANPKTASETATQTEQQSTPIQDNIEDVEDEDEDEDFKTINPLDPKIASAVTQYCMLEANELCQSSEINEESLIECINSEGYYYTFMSTSAPKCNDVFEYTLNCLGRYTCDSNSEYNIDRFNRDSDKLREGICDETQDYRTYFNCLVTNDLCDEEILKRCGAVEYPENSHRD